MRVDVFQLKIMSKSVALRRMSVACRDLPITFFDSIVKDVNSYG